MWKPSIERSKQLRWRKHSHCPYAPMTIHWLWTFTTKMILHIPKMNPFCVHAMRPAILSIGLQMAAFMNHDTGEIQLNECECEHIVNEQRVRLRYEVAIEIVLRKHWTVFSPWKRKWHALNSTRSVIESFLHRFAIYFSLRQPSQDARCLVKAKHKFRVPNNDSTYSILLLLLLLCCGPWPLSV